MKRHLTILIGTLLGGASAWACGPYSGPLPPLPPPVIVYRAPVVVPTRVVYVTSTPVFYAPVPALYSAPVAYAAPVYYAPPTVRIVTRRPWCAFGLGWHHGGGHRR